jgi:hypothetical protein
MSIVRDLGDKCKSLAPSLFTPLLIIVVGTLAFGLGRMSRVVEEREPIKIENIAPATVNAAQVVSVPAPSAAKGQVAASKNGTKYYFPTCSGIKRIKPENLVWFKTEADAKAAGLSIASGCHQ